MLVILGTGATFVKKNSCLVARIASFDTAGQHLLTLRILESYPSKDIEHVRSHTNDVIINMLSRIKGTVMHIEKALINDCLYLFQKYPENFAFQLFIILQ